jgi:hypothetical protein
MAAFVFSLLFEHPSVQPRKGRLLAPPNFISGVALGKKHLFLLAGVGLAVSGIATMMLTYQGLAQTPDQNTFSLAEIHSVRMEVHDHVPIVVVKGGQRMQVPENIGIAPELWKDHSLDSFGPASIAPMHTHDKSGTIHIESISAREFTLGEFVRIWGIADEVERVMDASGQEIHDFQNHILEDNKGLVLELRD